MNLRHYIRKSPDLYRMCEKALIIIKMLKNFTKIPWYFKCKRQYKKMCLNCDNPIKKIVFVPILEDYKKENGSIGQYTFQDLWAAKKVAALPKDREHYDIGSRVDGFITHLLSFRSNITLIDIRPMSIKIDENLNFLQADATNLDGLEDNSCSSISSLCALEHFGLGRYGDPINPMSCIDAFHSIQRVCKRGGGIFISVPVGEECVQFNGQRIFNPKSVISEFGQCKLKEFSIATSRKIVYNVNWRDYKGICDMERKEIGILFGLFHFEKL